MSAIEPGDSLAINVAVATSALPSLLRQRSAGVGVLVAGLVAVLVGSAVNVIRDCYRGVAVFVTDSGVAEGIAVGVR